MATKIIREPIHIEALAELLRGRKLPITVTWVAGASRSGQQNRLSHRWYSDISRQLGDQTVEEVRGECKLRFGVPILRRDNLDFMATYDRVLKPIGYSEKLAAIISFDLPVTRLLTVKQMTEYMDSVQREYTQQGVRLTDPDAMKYEQEFGAPALHLVHGDGQ